MADLELNGVAIVSGRVHMPRVGLWTADLELDDGEAPTGRVTLTSGDGELSLSGYIRRGGSFAEVAQVHVVAGAGGLEQEAPAVYYRGVSVRTPLNALLSGLGETLATSSDATALGTYLERWTREKGTGSLALAHLAEAAGVDWRALDDGTIWLGHDTYPEVDLPEEDYELLEDRPSEYRITIFTEQFPAQLRPGTTFLGRKVEFVEYNLSSRSLATQVWFQRNAPSSHPVLGPLQRIIRQETRETKYHRLFQARVQSQGSDDSVSVVFDDRTMPPMTGVPLYTFAPGIKVSVLPGAECVVAFSGGNPAKPFVLAWKSGTTTEVPVADGGTLQFTPNAGTAAAVLAYYPPGITAPPAVSPVVNLSLSGRIKS